MGSEPFPHPDQLRRKSSLGLFIKTFTVLDDPGNLQGLVFKNIAVDVADKRILWSVSGQARPNKILAILGPSGSGKTTLLNTIAGQVKRTSGTVTLNGHNLTKNNRRKICYVQQADIFFPNLTLKETIRYSALLRLPREFSLKEKLAKVDEIIDILHLKECQNTIIGNQLVRGLSGGEKKRANIGCELLTDPTLLLLDEPTSSLDSFSALNLMEILYDVASKGDKTIVTSIHQPSSQLFHMFDGLMLLAKGKVAYFGKASAAMDHMSSVGLRCTMHYNPADYLLELVSKDESRKVLIGEDPKQEERPPQKKWWQSLLHHQSSHSLPPPEDTEAVRIQEYLSIPTRLRKQLPTISESNSGSTHEGSGVNSSESSEDEDEGLETLSTGSDSVGGDSLKNIPVNRKWATRWYWQFLVLTVRTFRVSRHSLIAPINIIQSFLMTIVIALIWFQVPKREKSIADGYGYLFFTIVFWCFNSTFGVAFTFPSDHIVVTKERASGMYHLSAYFMAKLLSELPLMLLTPLLYHIITYFIVGLAGVGEFFGTALVIIIICLVAQSFGLLLGAVIMDVKRIIVYGSICILTFMLIGGFYIQNLPSWLEWAQYLSFITYGFNAALQVNYPEYIQYSCAETSVYEVCLNATSLGNVTISGTDILNNIDVALPLYANLLVMILFALIFQVLAYYALRYLHRH